MSDRPSDDSIELFLYENQLESVEEIDEEISKENNNFKRIKKNLSEKESEAAFLKKMIAEWKERADKIGSEICELGKQLASSKKQILNLKSTKNCSLNPVKLSPDLHDDIFIAFIRKNASHWYSSLDAKHLTKFMISGKETLFIVIKILKQARCLAFWKDEIRINVGDVFDLTIAYKKSARIFIKLVVPYTTQVYLSCQKMGYQNFVFEHLSKNSHQKTLKIGGLINVNRYVVAGLLNLHDKGVGIEFSDLKRKILPYLPALTYESLEINRMKPWFKVLDVSSCSFRKLIVCSTIYSSNELKNDVVLDYVEEIFINLELRKKFKSLFEMLQKSFPNLRKVEIDCVYCDFDYENDSASDSDDDSFNNESDDDFDYESASEDGIYNEFDDMESIWTRMKEDIENAPQPEIMLNLDFSNYSEKLDDTLRSFYGKEVNEETLRWISARNELKVINVFHT